MRGMTRCGTRRRLAVAATALLALLVPAGCSGASGPGPRTTTESNASPSPASSTGRPQFYLSVGDSYAAGYSPGAGGVPGTTRDGFPYQLTAALDAAGRPLRLVNLGCSGATSTDLMSRVGCDAANLGPGATPYPRQTQADAAATFATEHRGDVALVTVVIGGNDVNDCAGVAAGLATGSTEVCVRRAVATAAANITRLMARLRQALGAGVPIVGLTYPDVFLGLYARGQPALALQSVSLFRETVNPGLAAAYAAGGARFVDVTADFGAYGSMASEVAVPGVGTVPAPVARICELTYACRQFDIHPNRAGHARIASEVRSALRW